MNAICRGYKMKMKVKICGLKREEDIAYANELEPDYIGFVFALKKRRISFEEALRLKSLLSPKICAVGVFVDEDPENIIALLQQGTIQIAQLHGKESEETVRLIKERTGCPVWKAVKVRSREDVARWRNSKADCLLFDNGQGTGERFSWELLSGAGRDFFLAGGITVDNVAEAVAQHPYGIDVSSGVETEGIKDYKKMKKIIEVVRKSGGDQ